MSKTQLPPQGKGQGKENGLICYCFGYTRKDIEKDYIDNNSQSAIMTRIINEKKAGKCECAQKNPKGR